MESTSCGCTESSSACRSVDPRRPKHAAGLANSPASGTANEETDDPPIQLVTSMSVHDGIVDESLPRSNRAGDMALLGATTNRIEQPLHLRSGGEVDRQLRPCEVLRLLNSTPLGTVINERQLFRHRNRAGERIGDKRRIDFVRYIAWLVLHRATMKRQLATKVLRHRQSRVTLASIMALVESQNYSCALTGRPLNPQEAALDHVLPISRGGRHEITNAQVLHKDVNRAKGTLTNDEFISLCREVVRQADIVKGDRK